MFKRIATAAALTAAALARISTPVFASTLEIKHIDNYAADYANILSDETEAYINEHSASLDQATGAQIVVITVPSIGGGAIEEYATQTFRTLGIGDAEKNNGLLLLLSLEERLMRVEVGNGLEGRLPDGKTGRMQDDYMIPYFAENNFDEGMLNGYKAFYKEVAAEYNIDTEDIEAIASAKSSNSDADENGITTGLIFAIFSPILFAPAYRTNKRRKIASFIKLELINILISLLFLLIYGFPSAVTTFVVGTLVSLAISLTSSSGISRGGRSGGWSSGGWSSGSSSSSGGFSGGGGSSSGGGSTRGF